MALSVLALSRYARRGASSRMRFYLYQESLERAGIALTLAPFFEDDYLAALYEGASVWRPALGAYGRRLRGLLRVRRYDLLWIEKELLPWLPAWFERLAIGRLRYVVDFDDAWFLRYSRNSVPLIRAMCGNKLERMARGASLTIAGNDYLARWARDSGARQVLELPTVVDLRHYPLRPPPDGPFTVGWIGTPTAAGYVDQAAEALRRLQRDGVLRLLVIGAERSSIEGVSVEHERWSEETEAELLSRCHVGIMPLPDDPWTRGKSGYKLIQYMAAGRPVVASPVGANKTIVRQGENGFFASASQEWFEALARLRNDPALRLKLGAAGRRSVASDYSLQATANTLVRALYAAVGRAITGGAEAATR